MGAPKERKEERNTHVLFPFRKRGKLVKSSALPRKTHGEKIEASYGSPFSFFMVLKAIEKKILLNFGKQDGNG